MYAIWFGILGAVGRIKQSMSVAETRMLSWTSGVTREDRISITNMVR